MSYRKIRIACIGPALLLVGGAAAQVLDSNLVMGFETPLAWAARGNTAFSTSASSTSTRTQGSAAFALLNPSDLTTLTSLPVASTAKALSGIGDTGAIFEVDVALPAQQGNPVNQGGMQLFISCPSRQLNNVLIGNVSFTGMRTGIYQTVKFPIGDSVRSVLGGASFTDLTFQFMLSSPGTGSGTYLFDNLRVHAVPLVMANAGTLPPPGYGGSVDLVAIGATPASQLFDAAPLQVPDSFHLKLGVAGATSVLLEIGYDGSPSFACTYRADLSDASGKSYLVNSCTGGVQAGDLVGASWAQLTIQGGDPSVKIRAQLAKSPVGDQVGAGIIPPMPTYWGSSDSCTPAPVAGTVVTVSASCASQASEINRIVTAYFNKVANSNAPPNWIVTPTPEFARRHDDGPPHDNLTGPPPPPGDPPFDVEKHVNRGGPFDAYWRLAGDLDAKTTPDNHATTHLDATLSAHAVLFGEDVDVMSIRSEVNTDTGQVTATGQVSPKSSGSLHMYLFGIEVPGGGDVDASTGFNFNFGDSHDFNLPPIQIWVFEITLGATARIGVNASGGLAASGFNVAITPFAAVGAHVEGGVSIGIASGGVDVRVDLLGVKTPIVASATWAVRTDPAKCNITLDFLLDGQAVIDSLGGRVDLVATFGICPFCYDDSWTIFRWDPLLSQTFPLFHFSTSAQAFPLPPDVCKAPLTVTITSPSSSTVNSSIFIPLLGTAYSPNNFSFAPCDNFTWSLDPPPSQTGDVLQPATGKGCNVFVKFASPIAPATTSARTITLSAFYNFPTLQETGSASKAVTVTQLPPGDYIEQTIPAPAGNPLPPQPPYNGQFLTIYVPQQGSVIQLFGETIGVSGTTTWEATDSGGATTTIGTGLNVNWTIMKFDTYTVKMTTRDSGGNVVGMAQMQVGVALTPR